MRCPSSARSRLSDATSSIVGVTSTVRNVVTCGAVKALRTIACAVCLRTPRIGVRVVREPSSPPLGMPARATSGEVVAAASPRFAKASTS